MAFGKDRSSPIREELLKNQGAQELEWRRAFAMGGIIRDSSVPGQLVYVSPVKTYVCLFEGADTPICVLLQRREPSQRLNTFSASLFECQVPTCKAPVREQLCLVEADGGTPLRRWTYCLPCGGSFRAELEAITYIEQEHYGVEET